MNPCIRIISTLALDFIWIEKETKTMNLKVDEFCHKLSPDNYVAKSIGTFLFQSSSFNLWIISMILYIIGLFVLLFHFLPKKAILSKLIRQIQRIDQQTVTEKMNFVKRVGYFMILGNIITILSREWIYSLANLSTVRMSEVFLYNVMISIFVIKETRLCILLNSLEIFLLNFMNFYVIESHQKYRVLFNSMTSLIISSTLMFYSLRDYKDSFETKKSFQDHVSMMRRILELFPSGLMFFEKQKCIYKNRFWYDLVKKSLTSPEDIGRIVYPKDELEEKSEILLERIRSIKDDSNSLLDEIFAVETKMRCSITKKKLMKKNGFISFKTNENSDVYEFELKSENGHQLAEFATKFSIFEFSSRDTLLMVVINDVSDQLKMKEARMHEQLKSVMLCSVSHELHSPINQINGTLTLLEDNVPQSGIPLIKIAKSSTELLKLKVGDILDFGEIQTQHFKLETEDFNPRKLGIELDEIFSPVVNSSKIELYFIINEKTPMVVHHDYKRIKQILANFMGNSVKY